jgi:hypothetical protein
MMPQRVAEKNAFRRSGRKLHPAAGTSLTHSDQGEHELDEVNDGDEVGVHC